MEGVRAGAHISVSIKWKIEKAKVAIWKAHLTK